MIKGNAVRNEKYVVFKREVWDVYTKNLSVDYFPPPEIADAVVIRLQDVFAEGALWTYSKEIMAVIDTLNWLGMKEAGDLVTIQRLQEIADYFAEMAEKAATYGKKVPD